MSLIGDLAMPASALDAAAAGLVRTRRANDSANDLPPKRRRTKTLKLIAHPNQRNALDPYGAEQRLRPLLICGEFGKVDAIRKTPQSPRAIAPERCPGRHHLNRTRSSIRSGHFVAPDFGAGAQTNSEPDYSGQSAQMSALSIHPPRPLHLTNAHRDRLRSAIGRIPTIEDDLLPSFAARRP
jgi:hypothetical protein